MLTITEFGEAVQDYLLKSYTQIDHIMINPVRKTNGLLLYGMNIKEKESNISPVIYLDDFYLQFKEQELTLDEACKQIALVYQQQQVPTLNFDWFFDYSKCKEKLTVKLVGLEENKEYLKDVAHFEYGDLAGIYQLNLKNVFPYDQAHAVITVKNEHVAKWNVSSKQIYVDAMMNLHKEEYKITDLKDIIFSFLPKEAVQEFETMGEPIIEMYVLTNSDTCYGAAGILRTDILQDFSDKIGKNLIILPSSLHEVILVPENSKASIEELVDIVTSINANEVAAEDRLRDNAYFYDRKTHEMYQGTEKQLMKIKVAVTEKIGTEKTSVIGRLKEKQKLQKNEKDSPERSNDKER